jgi:hypothetical protein
MPIPTPKTDEDKKKYVARCMDDKTMNKEYKDPAQRYAVCMYKYDNHMRQRMGQNASSKV